MSHYTVCVLHMSQKPIPIALAIIKRENKYLLQLRDDVANIAHPGHWGLFGGHVEPGETPAVAVKREILEEINYLPLSIDFFASFPTPKLVRHVFVASLTVDLDQLELREGWDVGLWTPDQIQAGARYSSQADEVLPLAPPHQRILLEFLGV